MQHKHDLFLFIGIISATRGILSIGARLSIESTAARATGFTSNMIELGVSVAVILALGITVRLPAAIRKSNNYHDQATYV